jgi:hypothetical protein
MAPDVAGGVVRYGDIAQLATRRHEDRDRTRIGDNPAASFATGGRILLLEAAELLRRHTN